MAGEPATLFVLPVIYSLLVRDNPKRRAELVASHEAHHASGADPAPDAGWREDGDKGTGDDQTHVTSRTIRTPWSPCLTQHGGAISAVRRGSESAAWLARMRLLEPWRKKLPGRGRAFSGLLVRLTGATTGAIGELEEDPDEELRQGRRSRNSSSGCRASRARTSGSSYQFRRGKIWCSRWWSL